jgi:antirestriction protein ArdC
MAQTSGVLVILVTGKPSEHRLPQQADQRMAAVPAGTCVGEHLACRGAETEGVAEFALGKQTSIGTYPRTMELKLLIFSAAAHAQKAVAFLHGLQPLSNVDALAA